MHYHFKRTHSCRIFDQPIIDYIKVWAHSKAEAVQKFCAPERLKPLLMQNDKACWKDELGEKTCIELLKIGAMKRG